MYHQTPSPRKVGIVMRLVALFLAPVWAIIADLAVNFGMLFPVFFLLYIPLLIYSSFFEMEAVRQYQMQNGSGIHTAAGALAAERGALWAALVSFVLGQFAGVVVLVRTSIEAFTEADPFARLGLWIGELREGFRKLEFDGFFRVLIAGPSRQRSE